MLGEVIKTNLELEALAAEPAEVRIPTTTPTIQRSFALQIAGGSQ